MGKKSFKKDLLIKIFCILCAFSLWMYINSSTTRKLRTITVDVTFLNESSLRTLKPAPLIVDPGTIKRLDIIVDANISDINRISPKDFVATLDFKSRSLIKGSNNIPVAITHRPQNIDIKIVNEPRLFLPVTLDKYEEKLMDITNKINLSPADGFDIGSGVLNIDKTKISGDKVSVDSVDIVVAEYSQDNIDVDINQKVQLKAYDSNGKEITALKLEPQNVVVSSPILNAKKIPINLVTKGESPKNINVISSSLSNDEMTIYGTESDLEQISSVNTEPFDLSSLTGNGTFTLKLDLDESKYKTNNKLYVDTTFNVKVKISKDFILPITIKYKTGENNYTLDKPNITVTVSGIDTDIKEIKSSDIKADISAKDLDTGKHIVDVTIEIDNKFKLLVNAEKINPNKVTLTVK